MTRTPGAAGTGRPIAARLPGLDEEQARSLVAAGLLVTCSLVAVLAWGMWAVVAVQVAFTAAALRVAIAAHAWAVEADAEAAIARAKVEAVENHLSGLEPPGTGRHAPRKAAAC